MTPVTGRSNKPKTPSNMEQDVKEEEITPSLQNWMQALEKAARETLQKSLQTRTKTTSEKKHGIKSKKGTNSCNKEKKMGNRERGTGVGKAKTTIRTEKKRGRKSMN